MLELILATGMMSVLALTLYTSLRVAFRARDTAAAAVGPARSAEIAVGLVRRDLENALPPTGILAGPFIGEIGLDLTNASEVQFYAVRPPSQEYLASSGGASVIQGSPGSSGGSGGGGMSNRSDSSPSYGGSSSGDPTSYGGVQRVNLLVVPDPDADGTGGSVLVRQVVRNLLATTEPPPDEEILCRNVTEFTLRYYDGYQWLDAWDSTQYENALPLAVEVSLAVSPPAHSPAARAGAAAGNNDTSDAPAYRATRIIFLPCRNETALTQGATQ